MNSRLTSHLPSRSPREGAHFYRTIFLSDIHLGSRHCQAHLFLEFLNTHEAERIYYTGDIIDGWRLRRKRFWPRAHEEAVRTILKKARLGTESIFIPGNHDELAPMVLPTVSSL